MLIVSAYHAASHAYWTSILQTLFPQSMLLSLSPRNFSWRYLGNALYLSQKINELSFEPKVILATSMVNLSALLALCPKLKQARILVYFHENQFAYPNGENPGIIERQLTSLYTALAAHSVAFNSEFNRSTFLKSGRDLLKKMPDHQCLDLIEDIEKKSLILPVPISGTIRTPPLNFKGKDRLKIVWNHRWEYDKGPDVLFYFLESFVKKSIPFQIAIIGQSFRNCPEAFQDIHKKFSQNIVHWGYVESRDEYKKILENSDVVLSTAKHDFQGLAMQEAMALGCIPLAPQALGYPEYIPNNYLYPVTTTASIDGNSAANLLEKLIATNVLPPFQERLPFLDSLSEIYFNWVNSPLMSIEES